MGLNIDWSNEEIAQLALNLNNIGLHLKNAVACMYNTCTRLANHSYWTGHNFNLVAKEMNKHVVDFRQWTGYFAVAAPQLIVDIAAVQAECGGGRIEVTIKAENDQDWPINEVPETVVNASGDQIANLEEINHFLEDPGTAVSMAFFIHGSEGNSIKGYLDMYMRAFDDFYNALEGDASIAQVKLTLEENKNRMLYYAEEFYELVKREASMAKGGIVDTDEIGTQKARETIEGREYASQVYRDELRKKLDTNGDGVITGDDVNGDEWYKLADEYKAKYGHLPFQKDENEAHQKYIENETKKNGKIDNLDLNNDGVVDKTDRDIYVQTHYNNGYKPDDIKETLKEYDEAINSNQNKNPNNDPDTTIPGAGENMNGNSTGFIDAETSETTSSFKLDNPDVNRDGKVNDYDKYILEKYRDNHGIHNDVDLQKAKEQIDEYVDSERKALYNKLDVNKDGNVNGDDIRQSDTWEKDWEEYYEKYGVDPLSDKNADGKQTIADQVIIMQNRAKNSNQSGANGGNNEPYEEPTEPAGKDPSIN